MNRQTSFIKKQIFASSGSKFKKMARAKIFVFNPGKSFLQLCAQIGVKKNNFQISCRETLSMALRDDSLKKLLFLFFIYRRNLRIFRPLENDNFAAKRVNKLNLAKLKKKNEKIDETEIKSLHKRSLKSHSSVNIYSIGEKRPRGWFLEPEADPDIPVCKNLVKVFRNCKGIILKKSNSDWKSWKISATSQVENTRKWFKNNLNLSEIIDYGL